VAEGRLQYRMLTDAIHNQLAERSAAQRPRVVIFGESLGARASQDAFEHRGTQGLLDAGIDRAIWIGTPYTSKWEQEALGGGRPDVDRPWPGTGWPGFASGPAASPHRQSRMHP
jgi:uncharacterized membrane protein